jgi:hypothetical protein
MASSAGDGGGGQRGTAMPWRPLFRPLDTGLILDDNDVNNDDVGNNDVDKKMPLGGCRPRWWLGRSLLSGVGSGRSRVARSPIEIGRSVGFDGVRACRCASGSHRFPEAFTGAANASQRTGLAGNLAGLMCTDESDMRLRCGPNHTNQEFFTDHAALQ